MPVRTIHVLGAGQWQVPAIQLAKSMGVRVLTTDIYPQRPGYACADAYELMDIADKEGTLEIAKRHGIDGIVCDTTDVGVPTMAYVAEKMGLPGIGYETALNFTNKHRMRSITSAARLPNPPFVLTRGVEEARVAVSRLGLPAVIKPVDNQSSRGVSIIRRHEQIQAAVEDASRFSRGGELLVEGYLNGTEVTVEGFCMDGSIFALGISDKDHFSHRPAVASRLTYPADFPGQVMQRIRQVNAEVIQALGLRTGITHGEYMVVGDEVYLIEIAARGAGSFVYSHIVPYLADAPVPRLYLEFLMGGHPALTMNGSSRAANLGFFSFPSGRVKHIEGLDEARRLPGVAEVLLEFGVGDQLKPPEDDRSRPGLVVALGKTRAEVLQTTDQVFKTVRVEVE